MKNLTIKQIEKAFNKTDYALLRTSSLGILYGVNCKVIKLNLNKERINEDLDKETIFASCTPCSLNEYITHKMPFMH